MLPQYRTRQLICCANQLAGFCMRATPALNGLNLETLTLILSVVGQRKKMSIGNHFLSREVIFSTHLIYTEPADKCRSAILLEAMVFVCQNWSPNITISWHKQNCNRGYAQLNYAILVPLN